MKCFNTHRKGKAARLDISRSNVIAERGIKTMEELAEIRAGQTSELEISCKKQFLILLYDDFQMLFVPFPQTKQYIVVHSNII